MKIAGWVFMVTAWTIIITLSVYCIAKVLSAKQSTQDQDE